MIRSRVYQHKPRKRGRYIFMAIGAFFLIMILMPGQAIQPPERIVIQKGDTLQDFFTPLSQSQKVRMKRYLRTHPVAASDKTLAQGTYLFSGLYTPATYIAAIVAGPTQEYIRYTILEGWSIYDIDADMTKKGLITKGEFLQKVTTKEHISQYTDQYAFLREQERDLSSLEGWLYPDTYFLGTDGDAGDALIQSSLRRFGEKIQPLRYAYQADFIKKGQQRGYTYSFYDALILASIIEKEERAASAKPTIAGIFINRLAQHIQLGADITICYGLHKPYASCTTKDIVAGLQDTTNTYNTRALDGLPPTPIASISEETFLSLMKYTQTPYLFYLHDTSGGIHYAQTNEQHENNKKQYMY